MAKTGKKRRLFKVCIMPVISIHSCTLFLGRLHAGHKLGFPATYSTGQPHTNTRSAQATGLIEKCTHCHLCTQGHKCGG